MIDRKPWAQERYAKMNADTQSDVNAIVDLYRTDQEAARTLFNTQARFRQWKLWECAAIASVIRALA